MNQPVLPHRRAEEFQARNKGGVPAEILAEAAAIVERVRSGGEEALREYTTRFGDCAPGEPLYLTEEILRSHLEKLPGNERNRLERIADRIRTFAQSQLAALVPVDTVVPGGRAGHRIDPVEGAGCYAPGGRYPPALLRANDGGHRTCGGCPVRVGGKPKPSAHHPCSGGGSRGGWSPVGRRRPCDRGPGLWSGAHPPE